MTADLRVASAARAPADRSHLELKHLYLDELRRVLASEKPRAWPRGIQWVIEHTEAHPVAVHRPDEHRTWVWSDLHMRHANIIKHCGRPFADVRGMDRALMTAWTSVVGPDDTVLNGGDVVLAGRLGERGRARIREAPGRKVLVVGNHDFGRRTGVLDAAGHEGRDRDTHGRHRSAAGADAPPDGRGPARLVNLHGHVHDSEPLRTTPHINVCVEHTDCEPLALDGVLALAKRLLACDVA